MRLRYLVWIAVTGAPAWGQRLPVLVEEALRNNREILAAQKRYEAARQRPSQASSLPDPTVSVGYTSNGGPWPVTGIGREATTNAGIAFVKRYQHVLRNILRISEARYAVGRAAQQDVFKAQTQFSIFETQLLRYEQERDSKEIE